MKIFDSKNENGLRLTIFGITGSGKTTTALRILTDFNNLHFLIIDFKNEAAEIARKLYDKRKRVYIATKFETVFYALTNYQFVILSLPVDYDSEQVDKFFIDFFNRVRGCGIFFDEASFIKDGVGLRALYQMGRSKRISILAGSQRPFKMQTVIKNQSDFFISHSIIAPNDINEVAALMGVKKNEIESLEEYEFIVNTRQKKFAKKLGAKNG